MARGRKRSVLRDPEGVGVRSHGPDQNISHYIYRILKEQLKSIF